MNKLMYIQLNEKLYKCNNYKIVYCLLYMHGKNDFAGRSKNFVEY